MLQNGSGASSGYLLRCTHKREAARYRRHVPDLGHTVPSLVGRPLSFESLDAHDNIIFQIVSIIHLQI